MSIPDQMVAVISPKMLTHMKLIDRIEEIELELDVMKSQIRESPYLQDAVIRRALPSRV